MLLLKGDINISRQSVRCPTFVKPKCFPTLNHPTDSLKQWEACRYGDSLKDNDQVCTAVIAVLYFLTSSNPLPLFTMELSDYSCLLFLKANKQTKSHHQIYQSSYIVSTSSQFFSFFSSFTVQRAPAMGLGRGAQVSKPLLLCPRPSSSNNIDRQRP